VIEKEKKKGERPARCSQLPTKTATNTSCSGSEEVEKKNEKIYACGDEDV